MKRVFRYIKLYGFQRTLTKVFGRLRPNLPLWLILNFPKYFKNGKKVAIIGCGHHAYSSIAFYLSTNTNAKIIGVYDIDKGAASSLAKAYGTKSVDLDDLLNTPNNKPDLVYVCTNHATHTDISLKFLEVGCDVFIEKPISVNEQELNKLSAFASKNNSLKLYAGYNRPLSPAISKIKNLAINKCKPFTMSCFIIGHVIEEGHWYRDSKEGTRIISNLSHWIDLSMHMLYWSKWPDKEIDVTISYSFKGEYSKNFNAPFTINLSTLRGDLCSMTFSCREEPYEGVNETINFQQEGIIAKIDDFRSMSTWVGNTYSKHSFWPKNNGHKASIYQPFKKNHRSWDELSNSTYLILFIDDMVKNHITNKTFKIQEL
jgi:predicted dehydrogenase